MSSSEGILKQLFGSRTRVRILKLMLLHPDSMYFVREITRKIGEQINSVRRELMTLKTIGILKTKSKDKKKYFYANTDYLLYSDLKSIMTKTQDSKEKLVKTISELGNVNLIILCGSFIDEANSVIDLFMVGDLDKNHLEEYLATEEGLEHIRYSIMSQEDFLYRLEYGDKLLLDILRNKNYLVAKNDFDEDVKRKIAFPHLFRKNR